MPTSDIEKLRATLEFYADPLAHSEYVPDFYSEMSFGDRAQEALALLDSLPSPEEG